jgi:hypothetical protein
VLDLTLPEAILYLRAISLTFSTEDKGDTITESIMDNIKPGSSYTHQGTLTPEDIARFTNGK